MLSKEEIILRTTEKVKAVEKKNGWLVHIKDIEVAIIVDCLIEVMQEEKGTKIAKTTKTKTNKRE